MLIASSSYAYPVRVGAVPVAWSWQLGVAVRAELLTPATDLPIDLAVLKDQILRVQNGDAEDIAIELYLRAATATAERWTRRAVRPQTWRMRLAGFPAGDIVCIRPPLLEVDAFTYRDGSGADVAVDPSSYTVVPASRHGHARLSPVGAWPAAGAGDWPVTLDIVCGYEADTDPEFHMIRTGILLMTGELYKQRSTSVQEPNNTPANLGLDYFWRPVPFPGI